MADRKTIANLTVEGVVIVLSILLAFALDAWWDSRGQRQEEVQVLENLRSEFQVAGVQLDRYMTLHRVTLGSVEGILGRAQKAHTAGNSRVEIATVDLARTIIGPTLDPRTGTLDGLLASGRLGVLQSDDLRQTLSAWPGLLADAVEEEARSLNLILNQLEPALRTQMDLSPVRLLPVEMEKEVCSALIWGRSCEDFGVEVEIPDRWARTSSLPVNLEVLGLFSTRLHILAHAIVQLEPVREEINLVLAQIEESLGG